MVSPSQDRYHLIENQLPSWAKTIENGQPATSKDDMGQSDQGSDGDSHDNKRQGTTCHLGIGGGQQPKQQAPHKTAQGAANCPVANPA